MMMKKKQKACGQTPLPSGDEHSEPRAQPIALQYHHSLFGPPRSCRGGVRESPMEK